MGTKVEFPLLDLPTELIAHVVEQIANVGTLRALASTCRRLQDLAEPALYRRILIRDGRQAEHVLRSIQLRVERARALQLLYIPCNPETPQNLGAVEALITKASGLRELSFESPECNTSDFEEDESDWDEMFGHIFRPLEAASVPIIDSLRSARPLQQLRSLTLHLNGVNSPYWEMDEESLGILTSPTLQHLMMSCVDILDGVASLVEGCQKTPLKKLILEECNITHRGLQAILSLPQALEILYLGENCHNIRHFRSHVSPESNHLFRADSVATVTALAQQKDSLKEMTYATTEIYYQHDYLRNRRPSSLDSGFADFTSLEKVTLIGNCRQFERAVLSVKPPPKLRALSLSIPSNEFILYFVTGPLRALRPADESPSAPAFGLPFLRAPSASIPSCLEVVDVFFEFRHPWLIGKQQPQAIQDVADAAGKLGINLRLFETLHGSYFPPYLYGEAPPQPVLVFDAKNGGFVDHYKLYIIPHLLSSATEVP